MILKLDSVIQLFATGFRQVTSILGNGKQSSQGAFRSLEQQGLLACVTANMQFFSISSKYWLLGDILQEMPSFLMARPRASSQDLS